MDEEEAEAITNREILESDGAVESLRGDLFAPVFLWNDWRSVLLHQRDLKGFIAGLRVPHDAMTRDGECRQKI